MNHTSTRWSADEIPEGTSSEVLLVVGATGAVVLLGVVVLVVVFVTTDTFVDVEFASPVPFTLLLVTVVDVLTMGDTGFSVGSPVVLAAA